jgi:putative membrane protein
MNHPKIALSVLLVALGGCSHQQASTATTPSTAQPQAMPQQQQPSMAEQYGSAMGQPGGMAQPNEMNQPGMGQQPSASAPSEQPSMMGGEQQTGIQPSTTTVDVSSLNDAQVAAVLNAINGDQIREARLAGNSASMPQVRQYARQVLVSHQNMQNKLDTLYAQMQITPSPNAVSNQIDSDGQNRVTALESLRGKDFDRVFMDDQVRSHNNALELLDRAIPNAQDKRLKAQLTDARTRVDAQLKQAEILQQQVQTGGATSAHHRGSMNIAPGGDSGHMR